VENIDVNYCTKEGALNVLKPAPLLSKITLKIHQIKIMLAFLKLSEDTAISAVKNSFSCGCFATTRLKVNIMNSTSTICDVKMSLNQVLTLNDKGSSSDKTRQQKMKKDFDKASSSLEIALEAMLKEGSADKAKLNQFKDAWTSFKKTHEAENVPATHAGNHAEPQKSSSTMQAGNVKTMNDIISGLGGDKCQADHKTDSKAGNHADNKMDHQANSKANHSDNKTSHADSKTDHKVDNKAHVDSKTGRSQQQANHNK
jgi:hypothetical protein